MLFKEQISAARAILKITQKDLAKLADVSSLTVTNIEGSSKALNNASYSTLKKKKTTEKSLHVASMTHFVL